jgi:hypothetical protein
MTMMSELTFAIYLAAHGSMHAVVFLFPSGPDSPFDPHRSWLLEAVGLSRSAMGATAVVMAAIAGLIFIGTVVNYLASGALKTRSIVLAAGVSLTLMVVFFTPWLIVGVLVNIGIIHAVTRNDPLVLMP